MRSTNRMPRPPLVILLALMGALALAACGGSSSSAGSASSKNAAATTTTGGGTSTSRTALASCLKQHGVTLPARGTRGFGFPGGPRGGQGAGTTTMPLTVTGSSGTATPPNGAAQGGGYPGPGGGFPGGGPAAGNSKFAKAFAACRKKLGITGGFGAGGFRGGAGGYRGGAGRHFTPRFTTAELKAYVACIRRNGYPAMPEPKASSDGSFFPASVQSNAKFRAANAKCQSILLKDLRRPVPGQSTTPTTSTTSTTSSA